MEKLFRTCCGRERSLDYEAVETVERDGRAFAERSVKKSAEGKRLLLIVHKKRARDTVLTASINRLIRDGHDVQVFVTQGEHDVTNAITKDLRDRVELGCAPPDIYVAVGGSGTINEVVTGLLNNHMPPETTIAVVPMGDNADFSSSQLGIPRNPLRALRLAAGGKAFPIDVGIVNKTQVFMNMCVAGLACMEGEPSQSDALSRYCGIASLSTGSPGSTLPTAHSARRSGLGPRGSEREGDGIQEWDGNLLLLAVGNGQKTGGGMKLCPDASLGDGLLDITYVLDAEDDKVALLQRSMTGRELDRRLRSDVHSLRVPWLELHSPANMQVNCDGEMLEGQDFRFEVHHHRLRMVLPEGAQDLVSGRISWNPEE
eukprot:jgi/Botrbrau1/17309/Bobra.0015s0061.2